MRLSLRRVLSCPIDFVGGVVLLLVHLKRPGDVQFL